MKRLTILQTCLFATLGILLALFLNCETEPENVVYDIDGNKYIPMQIGGQVWLDKNLLVTKFTDGTDIPFYTDISDFNDASDAGYVWYNNDEGNREKFGALYNWEAVEGCKICPEGWHVPTYAEWLEFVNYLGGEEIAGAKMKSIEKGAWQVPNEGANNWSRFTALPGGFYARCANGHGSAELGFNNLGQKGMWWSSSHDPELTNYHGYYLALCCSHSKAPILGPKDDLIGSGCLNYGFSIRCIKDRDGQPPLNTINQRDPQ